MWRSGQGLTCKHLIGGANMAESLIPVDNRMVKQSNSVTRAKVIGQTKNANLLLKALIAQIRTDEVDLNKQYSIDVAPFFNCTNVQGLNVKQIRTAVEDLLGIKVFVESQSQKGTKIHGMVFIPNAIYENGRIYAKFNPDIKEHITQLKGSFTQYDVIEYSYLPSIYSQRLFELLKSYENGLEKGHIDIDIVTLRQTIECQDILGEWKDFKKRVLVKAHKDINKNTSLKYDWEPIKTGRKITGIRFTIKKDKSKRKAMKDLPLLADAIPEPVEQGKDKIKNNAQAIRDMLRGKDAASGGLQPVGAILAGMNGKA